MYPIVDIYGVRLITFPIIAFLGFTTCTFVFLFAKRFRPYRNDIYFFRLVFVVILCAAIGGRLMSALTLMLTNNNGFIYNIIHGGSVFYGGFIGSATGLLIICKKYNLEYLLYTDILTTLLPLGQTFGRIGCYCNGCCYGRETTSPFSVRYVIDGIETQVFPTWFLESAFCLLLFFALYSCNLWDRRGARTCIYIIAYATFRFCIEFLRGDQIRGYLGVLSSSQIISASLLVIVISVTVLRFRKIMQEEDNCNGLQCISEHKKRTN